MSVTSKETRLMVQRHGCRGLTILALILAAMSAGTASASAGTYDVYSCDPNHAGGATPGWGGYADPGFALYGACTGGDPEGIVTRSVAASGATSTAFQGAFATFDAPAGTTIDSIRGYFYLSRLGCNWSAGLKATPGDLGGRWVYALQAGYCGTNQMGWSYWDWPINDKRIVLLAACGASSCDRSSETRAAMRDVRITINDPTPPALTNPRGDLWTTDGWVSGMRHVGFDASDGSGIRRDDMQVDGQPVAIQDNRCDDTQPAPCPNAGYDAPVDTSKITPDGQHTLMLEAIDTAGNPTQISKTIRVDNTPPAAPTGLEVTGGDGWRATNGFEMSWTNPSTDGVAPIAGANYSFCRADGTGCTTGSRDGANLTSMTGLQVPGAGDWTLKLWLRDAAGNANPDANATVHLRFDPTPPTVAFDPPNPSDPTLVSARVKDDVSPIANAQIEIRKHDTNVWRALPSTFDGTHVVARLDDEHLAAGRYDLQAWAKDAAGNERTGSDFADGGSAAVRLPLRVPTKIKAGIASRSRRTATREVHLRFGDSIRLGGRLLTAEGNAIAGSEILVFSREAIPNAPWRPVASLKTSHRGYFSYRAPKGVSRSIRFRFGGTATIRPSIRQVMLAVAARSTIHADRTRLINGEYVHLNGRVLGNRVPPGGKLVAIEVMLRGHWRTFATTRSGDDGRWRYEYRFDGTRGNQDYRMRAMVPADSAFPYATGTSRSIAIHVRGL